MSYAQAASMAAQFLGGGGGGGPSLTDTGSAVSGTDGRGQIRFGNVNLDTGESKDPLILFGVGAVALVLIIAVVSKRGGG